MSTPAGARQVTLEAAEAIIAAARERARDIGVPMNIAVVDDGANLVAFARMDGAWLGSIDIALGKAFTARAFDLGTDALAPMSQPGQPLYGITATNHGHVVILPGGLPLEADGAIRGAIGVSGGEVGQDQQVAEAGAAAFGEKD